MFERPLNRIEPIAGPEHFQTYRIAAPSRTHRRRATCAEVDCEKRKRGYRAQFDVSTVAGRANARRVEELGAAQARVYGRRVEGSIVTYTFPAGQPCLDVHTVTLEREPFYIVRGGDHRGNPRRIEPQRLREADFIDHFATNQALIIQRQQRG